MINIPALIASRTKGFFLLADVLGIPQTIRVYLKRSFGGGELTLRVKGIAQPIRCRPATSDYYVLRHIFVDRDCDPPLSTSPRLIIDGGANIGYATVFYANKYPNAKIIAVEPDTENCERIRSHCAELPNVRLVQGGIWNRHTHLYITNPDAAPWSYKVGERDEPGADSFPAYTIQELVEESGESILDILKLDIEGSELQVFAAEDKPWIDNTRVMSIEVHGDEAERVVRGAVADRFTAVKVGEKWIFTNQALNA